MLDSLIAVCSFAGMIIFFVSAPLWILVFVLGCRHYLHMLQLSSYQFQGYFRYVHQSFTTHWLPLIIASLCCSVPWAWLIRFHRLLRAGEIHWEESTAAFLWDILTPWLGLASGILLIVLIVRFRPKKAKKKFVVTPRVRRLFLTLCLIMCVCFLLIGICLQVEPHEIPGTYLLFTPVWILPVMFLPLVVALAGFINLPVEKSINNGYIRDAQRILREQPGLRIIGVTGSFGKTSVKYYLTTLLSEQFNVLMTPESYNTPMGIVRTIREQMKPTHEIFVCEMGARHLHDIKEITDFVHPDDGILTAIGEQHMETFHTLDNIISTKYELLDAVHEKSLPPGVESPGDSQRERLDAQEGVSDPGKKVPPQGADEVSQGMMFLNGDNEIIRAHMKYPDAVTYGLNEGNDFRAIDLAVTPQGTSFKVRLSPRIAVRLRDRHGWKIENSPLSGGTADLAFHTALVGAHNVQNIMGAIAVATMYGIPASKLRMAVRRIEGVPHRLELKRHGNVTILDDAYNSNPTGAATALDTLALFKDRVKILVTPGMVELGEKEEAHNEAFGTHAASCADYCILVGTKRTEPIARGIRNAGFDEARLFIKETFDEASALMYELDAGKDKVILLENDLPDNY